MGSELLVELCSASIDCAEDTADDDPVDAEDAMGPEADDAEADDAEGPEAHDAGADDWQLKPPHFALWLMIVFAVACSKVPPPYIGLHPEPNKLPVYPSMPHKPPAA